MNNLFAKAFNKVSARMAESETPTSSDLSKLHTMWGLAKSQKFPEKLDRSGANKLWTNIILGAAEADQARLASLPVEEPLPSRLGGWASMEERRIRRDLLPSVFSLPPEEMAIKDDPGAVLEHGSIWEVKDLIPESLQGVTPEKARKDLDADATARAFESDWDGTVAQTVWEDGLKQTIAMPVADEVGPWTYEFEVRGEVVRLGYEGDDGRSRCPRCGGELNALRECSGTAVELASRKACASLFRVEPQMYETREGEIVRQRVGHLVGAGCGYSRSQDEDDSDWLAEEEDRRVLTARVAQAIIKAVKTELAERRGATLRWVATCDSLQKLETGRRHYYRNIVAMRKRAATTGLWYLIPTKQDVELVMDAIRVREGELL